MKVIPFSEKVGPEEIDLDLPAKLETEADAILTWIVEGAVRWYQEGLPTVPEVTVATDKYRKKMDNIEAFISERCTKGDKLVTSAKDLYAAYQSWAKGAEEVPLSQKLFGTELGGRGFISDRDSSSGRSLWRGISLKPPQRAKRPKDRIT
jgi:putative DNA primase/helicase